MPSSGGSVSDAPIEKKVDGQHHQLAYITPDEAKTLVDQGGKPTMTNEGVMAYPWDMDDTGGADYSSTPTEGTGSTGGNGENNDWSGDYEEEAAQIPGYKEYGATGWTGDAGVDAWESEHGGTDFQGTQFTGGTYATDDTPASRTISYSSDIDAPTEDRGRPDITYFEPTGTTMGDWKSKYELNQIKHIQDSKLNKVKGKLKVAGFTDLPKDATFQETKDYITQLNRQGKILDSWENATDKKGNPLYEQTTIDKWKAEGYVPQSPSMQSPGLFGMSIKAIGGAPLSYDQLMNEFNQMEEVGKSGGGAMNANERMKIFSPNQYASTYGMEYNPHTKTFTSRDGGSEQNAIERVNAPYEIGDTPPQESEAAKWFANTGSNNNTFSFSFQNEYNAAKAKQAGILGNPSPMKYLAVNESPFYDFLKKNKLDRGIL